MDENIKKEILNLVRKIGEDERELRTAIIFGNDSKIEMLTKSIERKTELLRILKA